ncbi:MAG TPA: GWxTD domain-containing protein [Thermoanaerobaculia bacterium]
MKKVVSVLAGLLIAAGALAELNKYKDWDKSPDAYFLTPAERTEWKSVATDEDAEKFIALYWAKRDPTPGTPQNEFRDDVGRRIAAADQQFKMSRYKRGADSVRGRLLIVLGAPSRAAQQAMGPQDAPPVQEEGGFQPGPAGQAGGGGDEAQTISLWTYDKDKLAPFGITSALQARVVLDQRRGMDSLQNSGEVEKAIAAAAQKSVVNPNATVTAASMAAAGAAVAPVAGAAAAAPAAGAAAGAAGAAKPPAGAPAPPAGAPAAGAAAPAAGAAAAAAAPPPAPVVALPASAKSALAAIDPKASSDAAFWSGPFRTSTGDSFLAMQFYLPGDKASLSAPTLQFGGVVTDESGKEVGSYWEAATFAEVAEGTRKDRVVDKSIALPPGKYKGSFGLFPAEGQPPVAASTLSFQLPEKSTDFEVSPLLLSNGIIPLTKRPGPTDPFVFGSDKPMKVEPKGDRHFSKGDSLWYFYGVANPAMPAPTGEAAAAKPRIMTRINVKLEGKDAFAPFTGPADLQDVSPGYYVTGSEIPLASFEPGYYTFSVNVRDLNAAAGTPANKGIDRQQDFVVLMPDGSMPPPKKAAAPAPAPPKKKPS